jgi:hypothetical protein
VKPLAARVAGIIVAPRRTVAELAAASRLRGLDVLFLSTLVTFLALAGLLVTSVGQTALVDQWERTATAFGWSVDDALYARLQDFSTHGVLVAAGLAMLTGPVLAALMTGILLLLIRALGQPRARAGAVLSIVAHASVILALRQLVTAPLDYLGETLASPTTLVHLLAGADEASPLARFLSAIDVFVIWWAIVLASGVAAMTRRPLRPLVLMFAGAYLAIALALALAMAAAGGTA